MTRNISISICVPALNEEMSLRESVADLLQTLPFYTYKLEVIIVDDGSSDGTSRLAEQLTEEYSSVKLIRHSRNFGIGACYRDALSVAEGDYFTWFPSDHENSANEFIQCIPYLNKDVVVTCHHRGYDPRPASRRKISAFYTFILNKVFRLDLKYYNGLTIFPVFVLRSIPLVSNGFIFTAESLIRVIMRGYKVVELPAPLSNRFGGKSKALTCSSFCHILKDIFRILWFQLKRI